MSCSWLSSGTLQYRAIFILLTWHRTGPHESTRVTLPGPTPTTVFQADACHITVDVKNAQMRKDGRHQTVHGYFAVRPAPGGITQLWDINVIDPKKGANGRPRIENDEYWEREKGEWRNEWKDIHKVDEPTELLQVHLGDSYVKILNNQLDGLDSQKRAKQEQNAVTEVRDKMR